MLRWIMPFLVALFATGGTLAADSAAAPKHTGSRAAYNLPPGLPRAHYKYRTTVAPAPRPYGRRVEAEAEPELLFTRSSGLIPYIPPVVGTPLLPGSSTLPGYYERAFSYDYQGPYYGGPYVGYWNRLPYACGIYGYC